MRTIDLQSFKSGAAGTQQFLFYPELPQEPWCRSYPLPVETLESALVTPIERELTKRTPKLTFTGGVFDATGAHVPFADRQAARGRLPSNVQRVDIADAKRLTGRSYFGGILFPIFGHVLIETLSRLWALCELDTPPDRILFQLWSRKGLADVFQLGYTRFLLESLGIRQSQCAVVEAPVRCDELIVPASTIKISDHSHPRFIDVYDRILATQSFAGRPSERIYLSRKKLANDRRKAANEDQIENLFAARGFHIIHPEHLSFGEQIRIMQGADVLAGTDGSAMHMVAFARPTAMVFAIDCRVSPNQYAVEAARGVDAIHVMATNERQDRGPWVAKLDRVRYALELLDGGNESAGRGGRI